MAHHGFHTVLRDRGFRAFLWTQFLGAFNDNLYRVIVSLGALRVEGGKYVSAVLAVFVLPSLLFSGYAGYLADTLSKRRVLIAVKIFEVAVMAGGLAALLAWNIEGMLAVVFLMGVHAAVFSPAKYGIVPEMCPDTELSRANALLEMTTFMAIVLGQAAGALLFAVWKAAAWKMGVAALAVAVAGLAASLRITRVAASGSTGPFRWNPFAEVAAGTSRLLSDRPLCLAALGICYFWFVAAVLQPGLERLGDEVLHASDLKIGLLWTFMALGLGVGNLLAGRLSGDKVELGLVPLGSTLMGVFAIALYAAGRSYSLAVAALVPLAASSGLFVVPLYAFVQQRAEAREKGRIIATNNFYQTLGMMVAAGLVWIFHDRLGVGAGTLLLALGVLTLLVTIRISTVVPDYFLRMVLWLVTHTPFRIRIVGEGHVPLRGPALLVSNHMSHADGFLIAACVQRLIRFRLANAIEPIRAARHELAAGHVVCIFSEGAIGRMEKIVAGLDVPVIPVHLDRKWPQRVPYPVTVSFGAPMPPASPAHAVRQAILELGSDAWELRTGRGARLDLRAIGVARRNWRRFAMADSTGREVTRGRMLAGGALLSSWARRARPGEEMMGVMLPTTVAGALVNLGLTMAGRVPVNLNFTAGREAVASAIAQCGIRTVVTSRAFLAKAKIEAAEGMVFVEDILAGAGTWARLRSLLAARFLPARLLSHGSRASGALATVVFSSGSTGVPKGVCLTHDNVLANMEALGQLYWIGPHECLAGALPLFHTLGFSVALWLPLIAGCRVAYHSNPTEAAAVAGLVSRYKATILFSTPTFCSAYTRKCSREEFASLRLVVVGAEKLRPAVAAAFHEKFGIHLLEGYGCTEMSPVVSANTPDFTAGAETQTGGKPGTVGRPLPGVSVRIVDPVTLDPLPPNHEGLMLVRGPNRMAGYLHQPRLTAEVFHGPWYITGDVALLDDEGFIRITDRLSRFSKIGGEMVPHLKIEEAIQEAIGEAACAVTAVDDEDRGERLVALYTSPSVSPAELWQRLAATGLPRLWIPKRENLHQVDALPQLGSGKLDVRGVKTRAVQLTRL